MPDTIIEYYKDANGQITDWISSRSVKMYTTYYIVDHTNKMNPASVLVADMRYDLALLQVEKTQVLDIEFPFALAYHRNLSWGDPVYVFGFPQSMRQLTTGVISPAPYEGYFSVDAVSRHGFSGGPVLLVRPNGDLELAGIVRSVPGTKFRYLMPPSDLPMGSSLTGSDVHNVVVAEEDFVDSGSAYVVGIDKIGTFLEQLSPALRSQGIVLSRKLLPPRNE
jgi:hypothetical protein